MSDCPLSFMPPDNKRGESDEYIFSDIEFVKGAEFFEIDNHTRLYYKVRGENRNGFDALVIEFESCTSDTDDIWSCPGLTVLGMFSVIAYFDGVRHMYMEYLYYPDMRVLTKIMEKIRELEVDHCWDCEQ